VRHAVSHFAICVKNAGYRASLELRKLYPIFDDEFAEQHGLIRVIDESGDDYLYPASYFMRVELPSETERILEKIAFERRLGEAVDPAAISDDELLAAADDIFDAYDQREK